MNTHLGRNAAWKTADLMLAEWSRRGAARPSAAGGCVGRWVDSTENARGRGTFCRFGSSIASRPVAHDVWQKLPRMRTSAPFCALKFKLKFRRMSNYLLNTASLGGSFCQLDGALVSMPFKQVCKCLSGTTRQYSAEAACTRAAHCFLGDRAAHEKSSCASTVTCRRWHASSCASLDKNNRRKCIKEGTRTTPGLPREARRARCAKVLTKSARTLASVRRSCSSRATGCAVASSSNTCRWVVFQKAPHPAHQPLPLPYIDTSLTGPILNSSDLEPFQAPFLSTEHPPAALLLWLQLADQEQDDR